MNKDFDEHMMKEGGVFRLPPREDVWTRIEAELDAKKERRGLLWYWWLLPLMLAGVWGGYTLLQQKQQGARKEIVKAPLDINTTHATPDAEAKTIKHQPSNASNNASTDIAALPNSSVAVVRTPAAPNTSKPSFNQTNTSKQWPETENEELLMEENHLSIQQMAGETLQHQIMDSSDKTISALHDVVETNISATGESKEMDKEITNIELLVDSIPLKTTENIADTEIKPQKPVVEKTNKIKDVQWRIVAGIGRHTYAPNAGPAIFSDQMQASEPQFNPTNPVSASAPLASPKPGTGFMLGVERSQTLSTHPRWEWQAGLHYQYQTVQIATGQRRDSAIALENFGTGFTNNRSAFYYLPGNASLQKGFQHRMHLQAGVGWHLHQNRKWTLQGLLFGGLVLQADYLVPHTPSTGYIPVKNVMQKGYFGLESGLRFQPGTWAFGLYGQTNLSSAVSNAALSKQYWRGAEVRIHYQLPTKK
jgi:hypothetical protein